MRSRGIGCDLRVGVGILRGKELLVGEALEGRDHALGGLVRGAEIGERGAVGGKLLRALVAEERMRTATPSTHGEGGAAHLRRGLIEPA